MSILMHKDGEIWDLNKYHIAREDKIWCDHWERLHDLRNVAHFIDVLIEEEHEAMFEREKEMGLTDSNKR